MLLLTNGGGVLVEVKASPLDQFDTELVSGVKNALISIINTAVTVAVL